ncbi:PulJ/GspJ family protein [Sulfuricurvum sp.]|uniref:PulJ/GspJ family protein n=1 Tax=Sulfuricurvum sp. TaxID=2025608 RepID=UPI003BB4B49E
MKRNAFTLIELLVSIALFALISVFLLGMVDELRNQHSFFKKKEGVLERKNQIVSLLRSDLDRVQSVTVFASDSKNFDGFSITGANRSLYGIDSPFVVWVVLKADNTLVRMESTVPITVPLSPEALYLTHSDQIAKHCEIFRIYDSLQHKLIYLKYENELPIIVEVMK